ncbi:MAG: hypothetical protein AVDCRST_MAG40-2380, partial [uncultured Gemmatimonadaceae bacterium]
GQRAARSAIAVHACRGRRAGGPVPWTLARPLHRSRPHLQELPVRL